jgi:NitT/TauT family transport system ATP-binding protein
MPTDTPDIPAHHGVAGDGLRLTGLSCAYTREEVLHDVSLHLRRGAVGAVIGPSGCGKSTLLAVIGGLKAAAGVLENPFRRPAFVFQDPCLLPWRTARDNIAFGMKALGCGRAERHERAAALLGAVGLSSGDGDKYPHALSGGMRSRVALARALAIGPDLLLLDEPFAALDFARRRQMQALVVRLIGERGLTAVLVTHDIAEAMRLADRVFVMSAKPACIVLAHDIARPRAERDESFIQAEATRLLADDEAARALAVTEIDA